MRQPPMTPRRSFVLMVAGALLHAVSCVCCNTGEFPVEAEGRLEVLLTDGEVPPWPDADLRLDRDRLEIEYTADDGRRYRVVYRVESSWQLTSLSVPETPRNVECDRLWSGDFAGHAALLAGVTVVTGSVLIDSHPNAELGRLDCLERIEGDLVIETNEALKSVRDLQSLRFVGGDLRLRANPKLASVDGLQQVNLLGVLEVSENPRLPQCQAEQLGDFLGLPPERRDIHTNLDTCPNARRGSLDEES